MSFTAKYESDCARCDDPIEVGQEAEVVDFDDQVYAHVKCHSKKIASVCPSCRLAHAGECF